MGLLTLKKVLAFAALAVLAAGAWFAAPLFSSAFASVLTGPPSPVLPDVRSAPAETARSLSLSAAAFLSVYVGPDGSERTIVGSSTEAELPIASITKLMVALVALDALPSSAPVTITADALSVRGNSGAYMRGTRLPLSEALAALLIASHNEMAQAIAEAYPGDIVAAMNQRAVTLGLTSTFFVNPIGLDPLHGIGEINRSSATDVAQLLLTLERGHPDVFALTNEQTHDVKDTEGHTVTRVRSTDSLLVTGGLPFPVRGGKTGETLRAKMNLVLATDGPCNGEIVSVVLGSSDSFSDMRSLLSYSADMLDARRDCASVP